MSKYISLTKVLLSNFYLMDDKSNKKANNFKNYAMLLLLVVSFLPITVMIFFFANTIFRQLDMLDQGGVVLGLGFLISSMVIFVFATFIVPSVFYFSKDIEAILPLPFKPEIIISAKFTTTLIYEYISTVIILAPIIIAYMVNSEINALTIIFSIICFLIVPVIPLVYATVISMVLMRFAPIVKNRDTFNYVAGIFGILMGVGISTLGNSAENMNNDKLVDLILEGNNSLIVLLNSIFPQNKFAVLAISKNSILDLIIYLGINVIIFVIFLIIAKLIYFAGVIGITESATSKKSVDSKKMFSSLSKRNVLITYLLKEFNILIRTPIYFLNCVFSIFLFPIFMIIPFASKGGDFEPLIKLINFENPKVINISIAVAFSVGIFYSTVTSITASAISREGQNYFFMKYIPVNYKTQINAKVLLGFIISFFGGLLIMIPVCIFIKMPLAYLLLSIVAMFIGCIFTAYTGIIIDLNKPVLVWENEQRAVKQNLNIVFNMLVGMAIVGLIIFLSIKTNIEANIFIISLFLIGIILDIAVYTLTHKIAPSIINKL